MPNWCENELTIKGKPEIVSVLLASVKSAESEFDFMNIIPMPKELDITFGGNNDIGLLCLANNGLGKYANYPWVKEEGITTLEQLCQRQHVKFEDMVVLGKVLESNKQKWGATTWYEWSIANWGTKWNAKDVSVKVLTGGHALISFNTAWSPPTPVIKSLGEKFPEVKLRLKYWECGAAYRGDFAVVKGVVTLDSTVAYSGPRGG